MATRTGAATRGRVPSTYRTRRAAPAGARARYAPYGGPVPADPPAARDAHRPLRLLYCGRIEQEQKRVLDLVGLAAQLAQSGIPFELAIAGSGPDESRLRSAIDDAGLAAHFRHLGVLGSHEVARAYEDHDALVIPSAWETGPLVAWQAMAAGLPVLTARYAGSICEGALEDGRNCLV